jgi:hypothetical protein
MQRSDRLNLATLVVGLLVLTIPVFAHHGTRPSYDLDKRIDLKGVVTEWRLINPHSQLYFDVTNDKGEVVHWSAEMSSVFQLSKLGWNRNALKARRRGHSDLVPSRAGAPVGAMYKVVMPDGRTMQTGDPNQ